MCFCFFPRYAARWWECHVGPSPFGFQPPSCSGAWPMSKYPPFTAHPWKMWLAFAMHGRTGHVTLRPAPFTVLMGFYLLHPSLSTACQAKSEMWDVNPPPPLIYVFETKCAQPMTWFLKFTIALIFFVVVYFIECLIQIGNVIVEWAHWQLYQKPYFLTQFSGRKMK